MKILIEVFIGLLLAGLAVFGGYYAGAMGTKELQATLSSTTQALQQARAQSDEWEQKYHAVDGKYQPLRSWVAAFRDQPAVAGEAAPKFKSGDQVTAGGTPGTVVTCNMLIELAGPVRNTRYIVYWIKFADNSIRPAFAPTVAAGNWTMLSSGYPVTE